MNTIQTLIDRCNQDATYLAMENLKRQTEEAQVELNALLAAGNAMAIQLRNIKNVSERDNSFIKFWTDNDDAALTAWEQVTK